jgi:hypothetical protein
LTGIDKHKVLISGIESLGFDPNTVRVQGSIQTLLCPFLDNKMGKHFALFY